MEEDEEGMPKADVEDVDGANRDVEEVDAGALLPNMEVLLDELGTPNVKEGPKVDVVGPEAAVVEPKENADFGGSEGAEDSAAGLDVPKENGLPSDIPLLLPSILGTKPPLMGGDVVAVLEAASGLKPA